MTNRPDLRRDLGHPISVEVGGSGRGTGPSQRLKNEVKERKGGVGVRRSLRTVQVGDGE